MLKNLSLKLLALLVIATIAVCSCSQGGSDSSGDDDDDQNANHPAAGELIFTEIMYDPTAVDDAYGEWVEILNMTDEEFNLKGCIFSDNAHETTINVDMTIEANGYLIFGIGQTLEDHAGDVELDWVWGTYNMGNREDSAILICDGNLIDRADYLEDDMSYEPVKGSSLSLCPGFEDAEQNDDINNWHFSTTPMPDGDNATPREPNDEC